MALKKGTSKATVVKNVARMKRRGFDSDQAIAAAKREKRSSKRSY